MAHGGCIQLDERSVLLTAFCQQPAFQPDSSCEKSCYEQLKQSPGEFMPKGIGGEFILQKCAILESVWLLYSTDILHKILLLHLAKCLPLAMMQNTSFVSRDGRWVVSTKQRKVVLKKCSAGKQGELGPPD